jgi:broad specificity phosphatase PhoE
MSSVLEAVEWGKPALSLLSQCKNLDPKLPAILHIRHTERPIGTQKSMDYARKQGKSMLLSTERGKQAAIEFGAKLPKNRVYRIFHTNVERTIETAEKIHEGLLSKAAKSQMKGVFLDVNFGRSQKSFLDYYQRDVRDVGASNARPFFNKYISGSYPPWEIEASLVKSKRHAYQMMETLRTATPDSMDVYVSHEIVCAEFLFHWFGVLVDERWIDFLDGFIMQLTNERLSVYTKDGKKETYYPYWWSLK